MQGGQLGFLRQGTTSSSLGVRRDETLLWYFKWWCVLDLGASLLLSLFGLILVTEGSGTTPHDCTPNFILVTAVTSIFAMGNMQWIVGVQHLQLPRNLHFAEQHKHLGCTLVVSMLSLLFYIIGLVESLSLHQCWSLLTDSISILVWYAYVVTCGFLIFNRVILLILCVLFLSGCVPDKDAAVLPQHQRPARGLHSDVIGQLEVQELGDTPESLPASQCAICMEDFRKGDMIRSLPCGHYFHTLCVDMWLRRVGRCPMRCDCDFQKQIAAKAGDTPQDLESPPTLNSDTFDGYFVDLWSQQRTAGPLLPCL